MNSKVVIAVAAVVILVGAGIGAFALMNNGSKDGSDSSTLSIDSPGEYVNGTYDKVVIGKGVGDGDVTLKGIKILKELIIRGGGSHSVTMDGCDASGAKTTVEKEGGEAPRINLVNSQVGEMDVTGQAIIEGDAASKVQTVNAAGASVTIQGDNTAVGAVKATENASVNVTGGSVDKVEATGSTVSVTGENATISDLSLSGTNTVSVQNGTVDNVSVQTDATMNLEVGADGTLQTVVYGDNVMVTTTGADTETKLAESDQKMAEGTQSNGVTVNGENQHIHDYELVSADWATLDKQTMTVTGHYVCSLDAEHTIDKTVDVTKDVIAPTCDSAGYTVYHIAVDGDNGYRSDEVAALGHDYEKTCTWNEGHGAATIRFVCKHDCSHTDEFVTQDVQTQVTQPTCTQKGSTTYTVSGTRDGVEYSFTDTVETDALGHNYGPEYPDWNTLDKTNMTVIVKSVCENDQNHVNERTATVTKRIVEPTCDTGGYTSFFSDVPGDNGYQTDVVSALGHDYRKDCVWDQDHASATITFICANDRSHVITFDTQDVQTQVTQPTCTEKGSIVYTVSGTRDGVEYRFSDTVEMDVLGHDYSPEYPDWTTLDRDNKTVVVKSVCANDQNHVTERTVTVTERIVEPTCESQGYTVYFTNLPGDNGSQMYDIESPLGHSYVPSYNWSRDHTSVTVVFTCENDESHVIQYTTQDVNVQETPATCTAGGSVTYSISGTYEGMAYSDTQTVTVGPLGHAYSITYKWSNDGTACDVLFTCANNHEHDHTIHAEVTTTVLLEPDCDTAGCNKYSISGEYDGVQYADETARDIPATGHTYSEVRFVWSQDNSACTAVRTCMDCDDELTEQGQVQIEVLTPADVGIEGDARYTATFESYDQQTKVAPIPALDGLTVTVFGGKVAKYGQDPTKSSITVAENTVVIVSQPGDGFTFWTDDYGDYIPGESFDILVTCNLYVTAHYEEDFVYGDWVVVSEQSCTEDGLWYRASGDMREYRTFPALGHISDGNLVVDTPATCTAEGIGHTVCERCHGEIAETIPAAGHHYEFKVAVEAHGSSVGKMRGTCTECDDVILKDYISPIYPTGDMVVTFDWSHMQSVELTDREEVHTTWTFTDANDIERQAYLFKIQLDKHKGGQSISGVDVTSWFFWADYGQHSPVYVARHNQSVPAYGGNNGDVSWSVAGYADDISEFIYFIDNLSAKVEIGGMDWHIGVGMDNGRDASALFDLYNAWANVFNSGKAGLYESHQETFRGWECTVYSNEDEAFYVNSDNCCVRWGRSNMVDGIERGDILQIISVNEEFVRPFTIGYNDYPQFAGPYFPNSMPTLEDTKYSCINVLDGTCSTSDYTEGIYYYNAENRDNTVWIECGLPNHYVLDSIEVLNLEGVWVAVPHVKVSGHYEFNIQDRSVNGLYRYMMELYPAKFVMPDNPAFNGVYIRCVISLVPPDSMVTVIDGAFEDDTGNLMTTGVVYGGDSVDLRFEEIAGKTLTGINVTIGDGQPQFNEYYWSYNVPEGSTVTIRPVYQDREDEPVRIDFTCTAGGSVEDKSGLYYVYDTVGCIATPDYGYIFIGWFDVTGGVEPTEDKQCGWSTQFSTRVRVAAAYMAVFAPIDASVLAEDYTIVLATNGFVHWEEKPVYLSALYGSTEYCEDMMYVHANPKLEAVHRWDITVNIDVDEHGMYLNEGELRKFLCVQFDGNVKFSGDVTLVNAVFESEVEYYDVTVYDCGEVYEQSEVASDMEYCVPYLPEREGYNFIEWNTTEDRSGIKYEAGDSFIPDNDLVLYAIWEKKTKAINLMGPDNAPYTFDMEKKQISVTYESTVNVPEGVITVYGCTLIGWRITINGQESVIGVTGAIPYDADPIVRAVVDDFDEYRIHFTGGSVTPDNSMDDIVFDVRDIQNLRISWNSSDNYRKVHYTLSGWECDVDGTAPTKTSLEVSNRVKKAGYEHGGTFTLTAQWEKVTYVFDFKKGTAPAGTTINGWGERKEFHIGEDFTFTISPSKVFTCSGYTLAGFNTTSGMSSYLYAEGQTVSTDVLLSDPRFSYISSAYGMLDELYPVWAKNTYTVYFYPEQGSNDHYDQVMSYGGHGALDSIEVMGAPFQRDGYTLMGWTCDGEDDLLEDGQSVDLVTNGSISLYAVWMHDTYTVKFDKNAQDAIGSMEDESFNAGEEKTLTPNSFTRDGYTFRYWSDSPNGQGRIFEDEKLVKNLSMDESITLYAIWVSVQQ